MSKFKVSGIDLGKYPLPVQPWIGGTYKDAVSGEKHTLISSVNDAIVTKGKYCWNLLCKFKVLT